MKYIGFFRGINVGGNKKVPMQELRDLFTGLGYTNIKTFLASGNILFESEKKDLSNLHSEITSAFEKHFGFSSHLILRTNEDIRKLYDSNPFEKVKVDKNTRKYITLLSAKQNAKINLPYESPNLDFTIIKITDREVLSVLQLNEKSRTVDSMKVLEEKFGKDITTRNWNTIEKIVQFAQ